VRTVLLHPVVLLTAGWFSTRVLVTCPISGSAPRGCRSLRREPFGVKKSFMDVVTRSTGQTSCQNVGGLGLRDTVGLLVPKGFCRAQLRG